MLIGAWEIIVQSWQLYKKNWLLFLKFTLLTLLPGIAGTVIFVMLVPIFLLTITKGALAAMLVVIFLAIVAALVWLAGLFSFSLIRVIAKSRRESAAGTVGSELHETKPVVWSGIGASFASACYAIWPLLATVLLFVLIAVAAPSFSSSVVRALLGLLGVAAFFYFIYMSINLAFTIYHAVIDGEKIGSALGHSKQLVAKRWWAILWRVVAPAAFFWLILLVVNGALLNIAKTDTLNTIMSVVVWILNIIIAPLPYAATIILFEEAKKIPAEPAPAV